MKKKYVTPIEALYIETIANTRNISEAAQELGVSYNTLIQAVFRLEKRLNIDDVFLRGAHKDVEINPQYKEFILKCSEIARANVEINNILHTQEHSCDLSFLTSQTIIEAFFIDYYNEFSTTNPNTIVGIGQMDDFSITTPAFDQILMVTSILDDVDTYTYLPFHKFTQKLWASKDFINKWGPLNKPEDLNNMPILFQKGHLNKADTSSTKELIGYRGIYNSIIDRGIKLKILNISGVRTIDLLCERGVALMVASKETTLLNKLDVENVLPELSGDSVSVYVKLHKRLIEKSLPTQKFVNWIFKCRDTQLNSINIKPEYPYKAI